jgi:predicted Zn-dependent protease with MMP-like domain
VLDAVERLERRWRRELQEVEFAVEDVPPADSATDGPVPLGRLYRGGAGQDARIVLYRRPIEARAAGRADLAALVHDLLVEQVADLIGVEPDTVDPDYGLD